MTKGFIQKHTAAELQRKADAHRNMGGGLAGKDTRAPKTKMECKLCKVPIHNLHTMGIHYEAKHPTATFNASEYEQVAAAPAPAKPAGKK